MSVQESEQESGQVSEEEKEVIEEAKKQIEEAHNLNEINVFMTDSTTLKTLLNLIDKLQRENDTLKTTINKQSKDISEQLKELDKKDKVIDLMAEDIYDNDNFWKIKCRVEKIEKGKEKDYIKERFFKKVEEEND